MVPLTLASLIKSTRGRCLQDIDDIDRDDESVHMRDILLLLTISISLQGSDAVRMMCVVMSLKVRAVRMSAEGHKWDSS